MKWLIVGDLQIEATDPTSDRAAQARETLSWILGVADAEKPEAFIHLGDYGEDNRGVDHYTLTLMAWFAAEIRKRVPRCFWLVGNHDQFTNDGSINLMSALEPLMPDHTIIWPWASGPEGTMFVSYLPKAARERFRAEVGLVFAEREQTVLFSHLPVEGALWRANSFEKEGLDPKWLPAQTFVGHYHTPNPPDPVQTAFGNAIWYCGSPMAHDFRDNAYGLNPSQQLRGIWTTDIVAGSVVTPPVFFENPHCRYFLSLRSEVDAQGIPTDPWFRNECRLPLERTSVRLTVPAGQETLAESATHSPNLSVLRDTAPPSATPHGEIDPDADPAVAVTEYVNTLPDAALKGLDRDYAKQVGSQLVHGTFQPPGANDASHDH